MVGEGDGDGSGVNTVGGVDDDAVLDVDGDEDLDLGELDEHGDFEPLPLIGQGPFTWVLAITSVLGLLASVDLTIERFLSLKNEGHEVACDINPLFNCSSLMDRSEAEIFGFPNSMIGIATYAAMLTVAFGLWAGAKYRPWHWVGLIVGQLSGLGMVFFLMYVSFFRASALCPWCMVTWAATWPAVVVTIVYAMTSGTLGFSFSKRRDWIRRLSPWPMILVAWYVVLGLMIWAKFQGMI